MADEERTRALADYRTKMREHSELEARVSGKRAALTDLRRKYAKTEEDIKALRSTGQVRSGGAAAAAEASAAAARARRLTRSC